VLLVEHHMGMVMSISDKVVAMEFGRKIAEGDPGGGAERPAGHRGLPGDERMTGGDVVLSVSGLHAGYGPIEVLHGLDFHVTRGEIVVILGANGAGKTTTMRAISGRSTVAVSIEFDGHDISHARPDAIVRAGIAQVPQGRGTFTDLTVEDNLLRRRLHAQGRRPRRHRALVRGVPALAERRTRRPGACRAASSRCSRSPGP
jgi:ABC-type branched-subunit amino acid transport system ATPase component